MSISKKIAQDYTTAYKNKDTIRLNVLRLVKTAMKNKLVEKRQPNGELSEEEIIDVLLRQTKQRQDSIDQYSKAGRKDLADKESAEMLILKEYLPPMIEGDELAKIVHAAIENIGAKSPAEMGKVIKAIMSEYHGQVDGKILSEMVRKQLSV